MALISVEEAPNYQLENFDKIIIGASIRYGRHSKGIYQLISSKLQALNNKPNAFFTVNLVARKPNKNQPETNPYLIRFLSQIAWQPKQLAVFAGKIDYQKYNVFDRGMIRMIMWMTKGPTHPKTSIDFTDWEQVNKFGKVICDM